MAGLLPAVISSTMPEILPTMKKWGHLTVNYDTVGRTVTEHSTQWLSNVNGQKSLFKTKLLFQYLLLYFLFA